MKLQLCHHGEIKIRRHVEFSEKIFNLVLFSNSFPLVIYKITFVKCTFILTKLKFLCGDDD